MLEAIENEGHVADGRARGCGAQHIMINDVYAAHALRLNDASQTLQ